MFLSFSFFCYESVVLKHSKLFERILITHFSIFGYRSLLVKGYTLKILEIEGLKFSNNTKAENSFSK